MTNYEQRYQGLTQWLSTYFGSQAYTIKPLLGDASFRRYFRCQANNQVYMAVDSPPELEDNESFVFLAHAYQRAHLRVPQIYSAELLSGYMLIEDLGEGLFRHILTEDNADSLYISAIDELVKIQDLSTRLRDKLPLFGAETIRGELMNFQHWFLERHLQLTLSSEQQRMLMNTYELLVANAQDQPQVGIHRDYHSRNLFRTGRDIAMIDFQDSAVGPLTYDIVSLIRDCYVAWPAEQVTRWVEYFYELLKFRHKHAQASLPQITHWFDWMGLQRHLKAIFIFARKYHRDGNPNYLPDIDRALGYVNDVLQQYPELSAFKRFMQQEVLPKYQEIVMPQGIQVL